MEFLFTKHTYARTFTSFSLFKGVFLVRWQAVSDAMLVELKQCFMEAYDDNQDGKIDIREVSDKLNILSQPHI